VNRVGAEGSTGPVRFCQKKVKKSLWQDRLTELPEQEIFTRAGEARFARITPTTLSGYADFFDRLYTRHPIDNAVEAYSDRRGMLSSARVEKRASMEQFVQRK